MIRKSTIEKFDTLYKNSTMYLDRKYNRYLEFRRSYGKL